MDLLFVFLLWSWFCYRVVCFVFVSLGLVSCMVIWPFKTRPLFGIMFVVLSLSLCLPFVRCVRQRRFLSLALSLSQRRWGNPILFGLGFPLCSLLHGRDRPHRPVLCVPHLHQGFAPHLFFFFVVVAHFRFGVFSSLFWRCRFSWWVFFSGLCSCQCATLRD